MGAMLVGVTLLGLMLLLSLVLSGPFSPSSLMSLVWFLELCTQAWFGFYHISVRTQLLLVTFVASFMLGAVLGSSARVKTSQYVWSEGKIMRVIVCLTILLAATAPFLYIDLQTNASSDVTRISQSIRNYYVESLRSGNVPTTIKLIANGSVLLVVLVIAEPLARLGRYKKLALVSFGLIGTAVSFSKGYVILLMAYIISVKMFRSKRPYVIVLVAACTGCVILTASAVIRDNLEIIPYFRTYMMSSVPAFQLIADGEFRFQFPAVFGVLRPVFRFFGVALAPISDSDSWVEVPDHTNVFTAFGPALSDYGIVFTIIYFFVNRLGSGFVFRLARARYPVFVIMYGYVIFAIGASIFSDGFANWSTIVNYSLVFFAINCYARIRRHRSVAQKRSSNRLAERWTLL